VGPRLHMLGSSGPHVLGSQVGDMGVEDNLANRWAHGCPKLAQNGSSLFLPFTNNLANLLEPKV